jgi:hypothetical protein
MKEALKSTNYKYRLILDEKEKDLILKEYTNVSKQGMLLKRLY